jgi:hypothetical protein
MSKRAYIRAGVLSIEEVFSLITTTSEKAVLFGKNVKISFTSVRFQTLLRSQVCSSCGLEGKFFSVEKHAKGEGQAYHLNMYAVITDGTEVLMTCDHTVARSLGGSDTLDNATTMCTKCNVKKSVVECLKKELILLKERVSQIESRLVVREAQLDSITSCNR